VDLLARPHHDGSATYVAEQSPVLGQQVPVFVRVPHASGVRRLWVRTTPDAEPRFTEARVDRSGPNEVWWRADVTIANPVTTYRFLLEHRDGSASWLTAAGVVRHDVPDATDFRLVAFPPPPAWVTDAVCYQVFPDRFARAGGPLDAPAWARAAAWDDPIDRRHPTQQLYGGDLAGVQARLDHIADLGANLLYLTPFFPAESSHRYNATSFDRVDPLLGGDEALVALAHAAHQRGMRVIGDLTANHSGSAHDWFRAAQADPAGVEAGFYVFHRHPDDYEAWFGHRSLPKFDLRSRELRRRLFDGPESVVARWLTAPYELDGWRVDVANMAGRLGTVDVNADLARGMRATMAALRDDLYLVAEHCHDASHDLAGDGWHGTMSYAGFTQPVWQWLRGQAPVEEFGNPLGVPRRGGSEVAATMRAFLAAMGWRAAAASLTLLDSHDTARFRTVTGSRQRHVAGVGLLATMPGVPMVFAGDEMGAQGDTADAARVPLAWEPARWDTSLHTAYRSLLQARVASRALRHGGLRWAHTSDDAVVFLRESSDERVLVQVSRDVHEPVVLDAGLLGISGTAHPLYGDVPIAPDGDVVKLPADGPGVLLWTLDP
jgi:alpha-glucosidase